MSEKTYFHGHFIWRELMVPDVQKARGFYGELFNWTYADMDMGNGQKYTIVKAGERSVGGMMGIEPGTPAPPAWTSYLSVADVDRAIAEAEKRGGKAIVPPMDAAGVGRFAVLMDAAGAVLGLIKGENGDEPPPQMPGLGSFCWETLMTSNPDAAIEFYGAVAGLKIVPSMVPGVRVLGVDGKQVADLQQAQPGQPSFWGTYVVVEKLEPSRDRVEKLGGKIIMPLIEVPKVGRITPFADTQGAMLALFEPDMSSAG